MSHRVAGFTLIAAGLASFVLEHLRLKGSDVADFSFSFTPTINRFHLGLAEGESYTIDPDASVFLGDIVAVLDGQSNIILTPYRDELLLLTTVIGLVISA